MIHPQETKMVYNMNIWAKERRASGSAVEPTPTKPKKDWK